jgi:hypothetical protein
VATCPQLARPDFVYNGRPAHLRPPWQFTAGGVTFGAGTVVIPLGDTINPGDQVTITIVGVTNPPPRTYADFDVSTSADTIPVAVPTYTVTSGDGSWIPHRRRLGTPRPEGGQRVRGAPSRGPVVHA